MKHQQGDLAGAASLFRESASLALQHRDNKGIATSLDGLAVIAAHAGQFDVAAQLFGASQALAESVGAPFEASDIRETAISLVRTALGEGALATDQESGRSLSIRDAISLSEHVPRTIAPPVQPRINLPAQPGTSPPGVLSPREIEVLRLLVDGRSAQDIARDLFISHRTVTTHISNILGKLGVESRAAAVAVALRSGIF